jgi:hypothetical protein
VSAPDFAPRFSAVATAENGETHLDAARPVRIRLLSDDDQPIANQPVRLVPLDVCSPLLRELPALVKEGTTDADGNVAWETALRGTYFMEAGDGDNGFVEVGPLVIGSGTTQFRIVPSTRRSGEPIWRRLVRGEAVPTERASVVVREERSGKAVDRFMALTDHDRQGLRCAFVTTEDGRIVLNLPAEGELAVLAFHPDGLARPTSAPTSGGIRRDRTIELSVPDLATVRGEVRSAVTGEVLPEAEIGLTPLTAVEWGGEVTRLAAPDDEGRWRFDEVQRGVYFLSASAQDHLAERRLVTVEGDDDASHTLVLTSRGSIRGSVVGLKDGETATASLLLTDAGAIASPRRNADEHGAFAFARVRPGPVLVYLETRRPESHQRMLARFVEVLAGKATEVRFDLDQGVELEGTVTVGGRRVVEGAIGFERYDPGQAHLYLGTTTDGDGRYRVVLPAAGRYEARLQRAGTLELKGQSVVRIEVDEDDDSASHDLRFGDARIRARLVDGDGNPLEGDVWLWRAPDRGESLHELGNRGFVGIWRTDGDGHVTIDALSPGRFRIAVRRAGYHAASPFEPIEVEGGGEIDLGKIRMLRGHTLTLIASGPDGQPLEGAAVVVLATAGADPWEMEAWGSTDKAGRARLEGLRGGSHRVVGLFPGYAPAVLADVALPGAAELPLQFEPGGHLEVWVYDRAGAPLPFRSVVLLDEAREDVTPWYEAGPGLKGSLMFTDHRGRLLLTHLRPGAYRVQVPAVSKGDRASALVVRGALSTVSLSVEP